MTEDELKALKHHLPPPPRAEAKAAALAAAMAAFDAGAAPAEKNSHAAAQGSEPAPRQMHASKDKRRQKMRAPMLYKIAAGIATVVVATPAALYFVGGDGVSFRSADERATGGNVRYSMPPSPAPAKPADEPAPASIAREGARAPESPAEPKQEAQAQDVRTVDAPDRDAEQNAPAQPLVQSQDTKPADKLIYERLPADAPEPQTRTAQNNARRADESGAGAQTQPAPPPAAAPVAIGYLTPTQQPQARDRSVAQPREENRDIFEARSPNPVKQVAAEPVSTFSADVDTASYSFVRRSLGNGRLPPKDAVRVEEMVNYFPYDYPRPGAAETPFQPTVTVTPAPWKPANKLVHIGIKGYDIVPAERPRANLVFLIDTSGSMHPEDRLPLVKNAFRLLLDTLRPSDTVGIVTYASGSGIALEPTRVADRSKILAAIDSLGAGGSTAGAAGISDAYRLAEANFDKDGVNRIILATDGDFNVGITNQEQLKGFIERKRAAGIFLSILGVGEGNYNDAMMQTLAQNGNGTAAYVDTLNEARKVLVDEASSTLFTIAKDVKVQVEFNPAAVSEYRLIGYETRALAREDFNNDKVDAGDIGSGHTVTAIYEVTPVGAPRLVDELRYPAQPAAGTAPASGPAGELGFLKLRYKLPKEEASRLITLPITPALEKPDIASAPEDVRFSVAVAAFGQLLRGLPYVGGGYGYDDVLALAQGARGADAFGYRSEFLNLVRLAKSARP